MAVAQFQQGRGLTVDGVAGPHTVEAAGGAHQAGARRHGGATRNPWSTSASGPRDASAREAFASIDPLAAMVEPGDGLRAPVTIDAPKEVEETRATLDVDGVPDAPVQLRAAGGADGATDEHTHAIAAAGVRGGGAPLPYLADLKQSFGRHGDVLDSVRVHTGAEAAHAARAIGAEAYASGTDVALAGSPSRDLIGHEAAHIVQQRAGVSLKGGVGQAGDVYEQHADEVGAAFAAGGSAEAILDRFAPAAGSAATAGVQRRPAADHASLRPDLGRLRRGPHELVERVPAAA